MQLGTIATSLQQLSQQIAQLSQTLSTPEPLPLRWHLHPLWQDWDQNLKPRFAPRSTRPGTLQGVDLSWSRATSSWISRLRWPPRLSFRLCPCLYYYYSLQIHWGRGRVLSWDASCSFCQIREVWVSLPHSGISGNHRWIRPRWRQFVPGPPQRVADSSSGSWDLPIFTAVSLRSSAPLLLLFTVWLPLNRSSNGPRRQIRDLSPWRTCLLLFQSWSEDPPLHLLLLQAVPRWAQLRHRRPGVTDPKAGLRGVASLVQSIFTHKLPTASVHMNVV